MLENKGNVVAHVIFGQLSRKCAGPGICKVLLDDYFLSVRGCSKFHSKVNIAKKSKAIVTFTFYAEDMSEGTENQYFSQPTFLVGNAFLLPEEICNSLGIINRLVLTGLYPIHRTENQYYIPFKTACAWRNPSSSSYPSKHNCQELPIANRKSKSF
jgi:hypothetical protein